MEISFFSNAFTAPKITTTISNELDNIKNGTYKEQIIELRGCLAANQKMSIRRRKCFYQQLLLVDYLTKLVELMLLKRIQIY